MIKLAPGAHVLPSTCGGLPLKSSVDIHIPPKSCFFHISADSYLQTPHLFGVDGENSTISGTLSYGGFKSIE
jgi:hypothetical protein